MTEYGNYYDIELAVPRLSISVGIQGLKNVAVAKDFILTVEDLSNSEMRMDSKYMSWAYSKSLDRTFAYVPAIVAGSVNKVSVPLTNTEPFNFLRLAVRTWHTNFTDKEVSEIFGRLWYSQTNLPSVNTVVSPAQNILRTIPLRKL